MRLFELFESKKLDKPTPTVKEVAEKHNVNIVRVEKELKTGIKVEMEHTTDRKVAREIALDHLSEKIDYYTKLKQVEENTVNEVADSPYRYVLWKRTMNGNSYLFQTDGGQEIVVSIVPELLGKDRHQIEVMFADKKDFGLEKTGKGDAFRIFATVAQILKDYIKDASFNIAQIFFTGKTSEPSRIKLYDRIARRLGDHIPGYKFIGSTGRPGMGERGYYFEKIRKRKQKEVEENFADGKKPGRKGLSRKVGIPKKATLGQLEKIAQSSTGERRRMAQWQLNMRRGKKK